jgi:uncharacterized delta-60 repeat protein
MIRKNTSSISARTSRFRTYCSYDRLESRQLLAANRPPTFYLESGIVIDEIGNFDDKGSDVAVQPDGKIVVVGASNNGTNFDFSIVRYLPNGSLDSSFGVGGRVITPVGTYDDFAEKVVIQSDGRIVVAGRSAFQNTFDFAVVRYLANGSLDTSFSGDGMLSTNILGDDQAFGMAIQPDGKVLVAGSADSGGNKDFALVRYRTDGALDTSFGNGGKVTTAVGTFSDIAESVLLQPDGKIILAGRSSYYEMYDFALARYNTNGSLDTSFSGDGLVSTNILGDDHAYAAALQPDGKILLAGYSDPGNDPDFAVVRYQSNGSLDSTFGSAGRVTTAVGSQRDIGTCMRLQPDGKILVGGKSDYFGMNNFAMVRYRLDGSLDPSLDSDGKLATHLLGDDQPYGMALQSDGKVLLAGYMYSGRTIDYALVRYTSSGALDSVFGGNFNTLGGTIDYTEGASPVRIDVDVQVYDPELTVNGYFNGATLTINRSGGPSNSDVFSAIGYLKPLTQGGNLIVGDIYCGTVTTNSNGTLQLTFNGAATNGAVNAVLQQIAYSNASEAPPESVTLSWVFNDGNTGAQGTGGALATSGSVNVQIANINDNPTISNLGGDVSYRENVVVARICNAVRLQDVDTPVFNNGSLRVAISSGAEPADRLWLTNSQYLTLAGNQLLFAGLVVGTFSGGTDGQALQVSFNSRASLNRVQHVLRCVCFAHDSDNPQANPRTISIQLEDGSGGRTVASKRVNVLPVNDRPSVTGIPANTNYAINTSPVLFATGVIVSDPDNAHFGGGQLNVRYTTGIDAANLLLVGGPFSFDTANNLLRNGLVLGQRNSSGGIGQNDLQIAFNASATKLFVQELIESLTFQTIGGTSKSTRTLEFTVSDGLGGTSNIAQTRITVL